MPNSKRSIAESKSIVTSETFRFFRDLSRNNRTEWMDSNRDRYKTVCSAAAARIV